MAHGPAKGVGRWLFATNHKDIGTMYLWFSFAMFLMGGFFAMVIRAELWEPGMQIIKPEFFNQMTTMHGLVMVFGAIMPAFVGLANWLIPMQIGAPDMALPRMNNLSFWILPFGFTLLASTCLWKVVHPILVGRSMHPCRQPTRHRRLTSLFLACILSVRHRSWDLSILSRPYLICARRA